MPRREYHLTNLTARWLSTAAAEVADYATVPCGDGVDLQVFPLLDSGSQRDGNRRHEHKNPSLGTEIKCCSIEALFVLNRHV